MINTNRSLALFAAVGTVMAVGILSAEEDRTIDFGSAPVTLEADTVYGRLVVNGALTVVSGKRLTVDSLCVASNINGTASLTLEEGATVVVNGTGKYDCLLGAAGGTAEVTLQSGSSLTAANVVMGIGYAAMPPAGSPATKTTVTLNGAQLNVTESENGLYLGVGDFSSWPSGTSADTAVVDINLNAGAVLDARKISHYPNRAANINFNGGKVLPSGCPWKKSLISTTWMNVSQPLNFVSVGSNPIDIALEANHSSLFSGGSSGSTIKFLGSGDLILSGKKGGTSNAQPDHTLSSNGLIYWQHEGKIIVRDPILALNGKESFGNEKYYTPHAFVIERGGRMDLKGQSITVTSIMGDSGGSLTNSGEACTLTLDDGGTDVDYAGKLAVSTAVTLVKRGSGTLTMPEGCLPNLTVQEGGVAILGHRERGYPFYRFNVYSTGNVGQSNARVHIGELTYLDGDEDVTQGWTGFFYDPSGTSYYNSPSNALDGTTETYWYDQRAQSYSAVSNIFFTLEYPTPRRITGYKWIYPANARSYGTNPTSWAIFGSDDDKNWDCLDYVEQQAAGWTGWTRRSCTFPTAACSITMGEGTSLKVVAADTSATVLTASETLSLAKGATVALATGTKLNSLTIDADDAENSVINNFDSNARGVLNITGTPAKPLRTLPLALPGAADALLAGWTVNYNGAPVKFWPQIENGLLRLCRTRGTCLILR